MAADEGAYFEALLEFVKESRSFDFTGYKRSSLSRRVDRRMQQLAITSYVDYLDYLQVHPDEFTALFNTVLINVTSFFRDREAWDQLAAEVLPRILVARRPTEMLRVWCAGCASGEEAYSVAILLAEELGVENFRDRVKIYATDVDDEALNMARHGSYGGKEVAGVPPDLLERYFEHNAARFAFRKDLRRGVIFGRNDLVQDAPISRVDLLVCRNTLMYLNAETQAQVLARFHYALADTGVLFLGKAEMLLSHGHLFTPVDLRWRFFRKVRRELMGFTVAGNLANPGPGKRRTPGDALEQEALLASPVAAIVLTEDDTVALVNQRAEAMFGVSPRDAGRPFRDMDVSHRPVELRPHLDEVRRERRATWVRDVPWLGGHGAAMYLDIQVVPLASRDGSTATALFFSDVTRYRTLANELDSAHRQVETAYEELQSTVEELETTNEELQSTVEELETTNEELQSTNEELETMNEELQSTNDELHSINDELQERTDQVDAANCFLESVLGSLRSAVVVVDPELLVQAWNHRAEDMWGLRLAEARGQHLLNLDIGLPTDLLRQPVSQVLADGDEPPQQLTLQAINRRGRPISVRVACGPLTGPDGKPAGAIVVMDQLGDAHALVAGDGAPAPGTDGS